MVELDFATIEKIHHLENMVHEVIAAVLKETKPGEVSFVGTSAFDADRCT